MKTQLFIENFEIELNEGVQFLLNKEFEDLSNPTDIINDWSKTVSIPFTENNNKIFGYIYNQNRVIVSDGTDTGYTKMGIYFDPTKKLDFRLVYDNFVLMEGYAKMIDIKMTDYTGTYNITLNGQLGKIFQELKKITFDTTTEDTKYLIHGEDYVEEYIDRNLVYNNWTSSGQTNANLMKKNNPNYNINDILGWAPNNSFSEGFDYKTYLSNTTTTNLFTNSLENVNFKGSTGIDPETVIPNGLLPREIGEYRSYLQLPFIYWNKLFQIFQAKAEEITGYTFDYDSTFFNTSNPDWYKLVYILKNWDVKNGVDYNGLYDGESLGSENELHWSHLNQRLSYATPFTTNVNLSAVTESAHRVENNKIMIETYDNDSIINATLDFYLTGSLWNQYDLLFSVNNGFIVQLNFVGENGYSESKQIFVCREDTQNAAVIAKKTEVINNGGTIYTISYNNRYATQFSSIFSTSKWGWHIIAGLSDIASLNRYKFGNYATVSITCHWLTNDCGLGGGTDANEHTYFSNARVTISNTIEIGRMRSQSYFTLNDLWNKDFNLFDEIIKYCKMYRIYIYENSIEKKIYFRQFDKYFENYSIEDWTNKLDRSKEINIRPITFENKYVLFNYENNKTKLGEEYREKYGFDYGEYRLTTDYNFNIETTELFKNAKTKTSMVTTDNVLSWTNLYDNKVIKYSFPSELYVYNKDKDNKQVDTFGCYYYHNGPTYFSTEQSLYMRTVEISDDTTLQQKTNTYVYSQTFNSVNVTTYPKLDVVYGDNICLFNTPKDNYTYINNYSGKATIYSKYWEKYINERYNIQNKVVTCYLTLTPKDWSEFSFNKFIKIDGVLYMVNKIYDYNIESTEPTKVDLITITDIKGYTE